MDQTKILWEPSSEFVRNSHLSKFILWLKENRSLDFNREDNYSTYQALWQWSVDSHKDFWKSVFEYFEVLHDGRYTEVHQDKAMPGIKWFEGVRLSYSEHIFRNANEQNPAIIFCNESDKYLEISWSELKEKVAALANHFKSLGVKEGDRVVAFIPNIPEATISFLAANSLGAIWSSCSPDFGADSVVDRFKQIDAKVLVATGAYNYGGKVYDNREVLSDIIKELDTLVEVVFIDHLNENRMVESKVKVTNWEQVMVKNAGTSLEFVRVDFNHPIWVLYSS